MRVSDEKSGQPDGAIRRREKGEKERRGRSLIGAGERLN
jgi:hypothetical protein